MKLNALTPMLTTPDLDASIEFYTNVLGFTCIARSDEYGWAHVRRDDVKVMFGTPNAHVPFRGPVFTGSPYFYPDDVDAEWKRLKDTGKVLPNRGFRLRHARVRDLRRQRIPATVWARDRERRTPNAQQ